MRKLKYSTFAGVAGLGLAVAAGALFLAQPATAQGKGPITIGFQVL